MNTKDIIHEYFNSNYATERSYLRGEAIALEGDPCLGIGKITNGIITFKNVYDSHESIIKQSHKGELFGESLAFTDKAYPASIWATTDCTILYISKSNIEEIIKKDYKFALCLLSITAQNAFSLNSHIKLLNNKTIKSKIAFYLMNFNIETNESKIDLPFNREDFARYLNVERPSLSRELKIMKEQGLIDYERNCITIKDVKGLKRLI